MNNKQDSEKLKERIGQKNSESPYDKMMTATAGDRSSIKKPLIMTFDTETLVAKTQERFSRALERRYQFESNLKPAQEFLLDHVNSKISLIIMYADLVGSTKMSMTLPIDKMVTIIRGFSYEMSNIVHSYEGYALKYVGDAVIAFFPSIYNKSIICNRAVECAKSMITIIKKGISPILNQYDYPDLQVKIGLDEGESVIIQHGHDESFHIDILGFSMNKSAKITSLTSPNTITIGEDIYSDLNPQMKIEFKEVKFSIEHWKYLNKQTGQLYKLYANI
ncbi:MAG: adenylate/guanylate cyclase domain-containing protein [Thermoproteota archaeon]|nr:adenylate/guanylate cyclase domain-containing protein [Thermoproteota archaeon]